MSYSKSLKLHFDQLCSSAFADLKSNEDLGINLSAEDQTYFRFNNSKVRQATQVQQAKLDLHFQKGQKQVQFNLDLSLNFDQDIQRINQLVNRARQECESLPIDEFCIDFKNNGTSEKEFAAKLPAPEEFPGLILNKTQELDFTGLLASGPQISANKNNKGQSHWFSNESFFLDYSLFTVNTANENKAVKGSYSAQSWNSENFSANLESSKKQIEPLKRASKTLNSGSYRAYLAPAAVSEILSMFSWGALSLGAYKKGHCALSLLADQKESLSPMFHLKENFNLGMGPQFNNLGEVAPDEVELIKDGKIKNFLISSRSAKEFGGKPNGAEDSEYLRSPEIMGGQLDEKEVLQNLGTGIYLSNLHYLNWSDLQTARLTGMTRYACFWVEEGKVVAPIKDMRFDDSLYRILGSELEAISRQSHLDPNVDTYWKRALGGKKVPGMLLKSLKFTL